MFWFFGHEACGILAPQPGIKPAPRALEGEVFTTGPPGKSLREHPYGITPETRNSPRAPSHQQPSQDLCVSLCVSFLTGVLEMPKTGSGSFSSLPLEGAAQTLTRPLPCRNPSLTAPATPLPS